VDGPVWIPMGRGLMGVVKAMDIMYELKAKGAIV